MGRGVSSGTTSNKATWLYGNAESDQLSDNASYSGYMETCLHQDT